ncbi:hypothetical protein [Streptomyces sp. 769]|nr:hypothetical protein [Streptomyces sp. 769]
MASKAAPDEAGMKIHPLGCLHATFIRGKDRERHDNVRGSGG